jgi:two-component system KDP operon response regulator KdpE
MNSTQGSVLLVEDDLSIRRGLRATLTALQLQIGEASTGEEALVRLRTATYDAVVMDLNMPGMGGLEACRRVRKEYSQISILVVTVRDSERDILEAFDAGADDYITKPFRIRELTARIRAGIRRRREASTNPDVKIGIFELQLDRRLAKKRGEQIHLTPTEFNLLAALMTCAGQTIPHAKLLSAVWGTEFVREREYLRTFILQLRRKLEDDPTKPTYLQTVSCIGYAFFDPSESGEQAS